MKKSFHFSQFYFFTAMCFVWHLHS